MSESTDTVQAPPTFKRLDNGLVEGVVYPRRADGRIEWYKLIRPEHIVFNSKLDPTLEKVYGAPARELNYGELIAAGKEVDPKHVLVLLMGFIELARLRGYRAAIPRIAHVCSHPVEAAICSCECSIDWIPNEEEPDGFSSYGTADATMDNTGGWGYLSAMAGNRAFVRAVRQGLAIPILGFDEIAKKDTPVPEAVSVAAPVSSLSPVPLLQKVAAEAKDGKGDSSPLDFAKVREGAVFHWGKLQADPAHKPKIEGNPNDWTKWEDISARDCLTLIKTIKDRGKKKS